MYTLRIKDDEHTLDVSTFSSLFLLASFGAYPLNQKSILVWAIAIILFAGALFTRTLLLKYKLNKLLLSVAIAVLLFVAMRNIVLPFFILLLGFVLHYSYVEPFVELKQDAVIVKKTFSNKKYNWQDFSNIVLKDNLLTLDFKNNKVVQLEIEENGVDEESFNKFCAKKNVL